MCIDFPSKDLLAHICDAHEYFYSPYLIVRAIARLPILPLTKTDASSGRRRRLLMRCRLLWRETKAAVAPGEGRGGLLGVLGVPTSRQEGEDYTQCCEGSQSLRGAPSAGPRGVEGGQGPRQSGKTQQRPPPPLGASKRSYISFIARRNRTQ